MRFRFHVLFIVSALLLASCAHTPTTAPEDRGFLTVDENDGTSASLHWRIDQLPVPVLLSPDMPARDVELVTRIVGEMNDAIGTTVFDRPIVSGEGIQTRVEVAQMPPLVPLVYVYTMQFWNGRGHQAETLTYYNYDGEIDASVVRLPDAPSSPASEEMVRHELGHALGLTHDDQGPSVMSPRVNPAAKGARYVFDSSTMAWKFVEGYDREPQTLTAHDLALLRRAYRLY